MILLFIMFIMLSCDTVRLLYVKWAETAQSMKSKQIYSSSRRRNLKGPEIQFYKTNCFLNHPFDSVVDKGNNSKKLSTGVDVVRL